MDEGQYDDAWRMLMKALEIEPDSAPTAKMIRQLETQQAPQVAAARADWLSRGNVALASSLRGKMTVPRRSPEATSDRQVALAPTARPLASTSFEVNPDAAARQAEAPSAPVAASV